jgi:hypothetical protein
MNLLIPIGSEIWPYCSEDGSRGFVRHTSMEVQFEDSRSQVIELVDENGNSEQFFSIELGENPTKYDRYLVKKSVVAVSG